jgi:transposase-like protein
MIERVNQEPKRRSKVVRIFPNPSSCVRLFSALLKQWHEDWVTGKKYLDMELFTEFDIKRPTHQQERAPADESSPIKEQRITVV